MPAPPPNDVVEPLQLFIGDVIECGKFILGAPHPEDEIAMLGNSSEVAFDSKNWPTRNAHLSPTL